jgi:hypothetical protein
VSRWLILKKGVLLKGNPVGSNAEEWGVSS